MPATSLCWPALAQAANLRDFVLLPEDLSFEPLAIMLPRGDWAFRLAVNTALAQVFRSGQLIDLYTKYLGDIGQGASNWTGLVFVFGSLPSKKPTSFATRLTQRFSNSVAISRSEVCRMQTRNVGSAKLTNHGDLRMTRPKPARSGEFCRRPATF